MLCMVSELDMNFKIDKNVLYKCVVVTLTVVNLNWKKTLIYNYNYN